MEGKQEKKVKFEAWVTSPSNLYNGVKYQLVVNIASCGKILISLAKY